MSDAPGGQAAEGLNGGTANIGSTDYPLAGSSQTEAEKALARLKKDDFDLGRQEQDAFCAL